MPMQANIDMSAIKEALQRRSAGQGGMPASQQMSQAGGITPGGTSGNVPVARPAQPTAPTASPTAMPSPQAGGDRAALQTQLQEVDQGGFDDDTKRTAKALIKKLMEVL